MRTALVAGLCVVLVGCGGEAETDGAEDSPAVSEAAQGTADPQTLGYLMTGPDGSEFEFAETLSVNGGETTNSYTYVLENGMARQGLYTQFVDAVSIEVAVTAGGPVTFELVRGTLASDGFSVDVAEVVAETDVPAGGSATLSSAR